MPELLEVPSPLIGYRERLESLVEQRDQASAEAEELTAGMREVALFRAANAMGCLGGMADPLLRYAERAEGRIKDLESALRRVRDADDAELLTVRALAREVLA